MTRICNTKDQFSVDHDGLYCDFILDHDDGKTRLYCESVELNTKQLRKLITWLERADRVMSRIGE